MLIPTWLTVTTACHRLKYKLKYDTHDEYAVGRITRVGPGTSDLFNFIESFDAIVNQLWYYDALCTVAIICLSAQLLKNIQFHPTFGMISRTIVAEPASGTDGLRARGLKRELKRALKRSPLRKDRGETDAPRRGAARRSFARPSQVNVAAVLAFWLGLLIMLLFLYTFIGTLLLGGYLPGFSDVGSSCVTLLAAMAGLYEYDRIDVSFIEQIYFWTWMLLAFFVSRLSCQASNSI